ncbi:MAG: MBL fold metallo-hydrolase, partial [Bradymonadaceae bacterium]
VFWAKRTHEREFLGGFHAFFAGSVEEGDAEIAGDVGEPSLREFYGCAARELFEEVGLRADPRRFEYLGMWRTPDWLEPRFETHFFRLHMNDGESVGLEEGLSEEEFICGEWLEPAEALRRWERGEAFLTTPLERVLQGLAAGDAHPLPLAHPATQHHIEVVGGVRILPLKTPTLPPATHTNCLVVGTTDFVVIDPGTKEEAELERLFEVVDDLIVAGSSFRALVLTHEHPDHIGGVKAVLTRYGVPLWCHRETTERLPIDLFADRELEDEEVIELGDGHRLRCLHTPGHARGHLAFQHEPSSCVLIGDLVSSTGTIVVDPPEGHMGDYLRSLERILEMEARALLPSHGWVITQPSRHLRYYLDHRREREEEVEEALRLAGRGVTALELVPRVYRDVPPTVWPLASRSLLAHLEHLVERGVAVRDGEHFRHHAGQKSPDE